MKKILLIGFLISGVIIIGVLFLIFQNVQPSAIAVESVNISDNNIDVKGTLVASHLFYRGFETDYHDETLYITIKGSIVKLPKASGDFSISLPNKYGKIKVVYLKAGTPTENIIIWSKK